MPPKRKADDVSPAEKPAKQAEGSKKVTSAAKSTDVAPPTPRPSDKKVASSDITKSTTSPNETKATANISRARQLKGKDALYKAVNTGRK
jgi:hypothetical protein